MFDSKNQFYPTPKSLIKKMLKPWEKTFRESFGGSMENGYDVTLYALSGKKILEPSAGKCDIPDFIRETNGRRGRGNQFYCIEIDPELQEVIKGKGYKLIGSDFLEYDEDYYFNMVLMNPPFNKGAEHVLKAWDVLSLGGDIVAVLNAKTITNPHTENRKLLMKLIQDHGRFEIVPNAFKGEGVDREADVDAAIVWLKRPEVRNPFEFDFESEKEMMGDIGIKPEMIGNQVAINDQTGAMIEAYNNAKSAFVEYMKAQQRLSLYATPLLANGSVTDMADAAIKNNGHTGGAYNEFMDSFKMSAWKKVMHTVGIDKLMTSNVQNNFDKFIEGQGSMAFTKENIHNIVMMLVQNSGSILDQAVVDVFDLFTKYHDENRCHVEGWKTNEAWKVNKKVILPGYVRCDYGGMFKKSYYKWSEFQDIDKAMCYLTGKQYSDIDKLEDAITKFPVGSTKKMKSEFFEFRCYKKGTIHLFFREDSLWATFNQKACEGKNWLGN